MKQKEITFPAVSICNLNPRSNEKLNRMVKNLNYASYSDWGDVSNTAYDLGLFQQFIEKTIDKLEVSLSRFNFNKFIF